MKILLYHTLEDTLGGAELVLIHVMNHFLKNPQNTVTILGFQPPDLSRMEEFAKIPLPRDRILSLQPHLPAFFKKVPEGFFQIKTAFLQRFAKTISSDFDVCFSTCGEVDFGRRGIQYIHMPVFAPYAVLNKYRILHDKSRLNRFPYLSTPYEFLVRLIAKNKAHNIENNLSLTNSRFMQGVIAECYKINAQIIYPSLFDPLALKPAQSTVRAFRIACVGRVCSDKNTLELMDLFSLIHMHLPALELMVAGNATDKSYFNAVKERAKELDIPVVFKTDISRVEIEDVLKTSLFFINPKNYEHFGIATLESIAAGCLPIVHRSGGSVEIVPAPELQFENGPDLVDKLQKLISDPALQESLKETLQNHVESFSINRFYHELDMAVRAFCAQEGVH